MRGGVSRIKKSLLDVGREGNRGEGREGKRNRTKGMKGKGRKRERY